MEHLGVRLRIARVLDYGNATGSALIWQCYIDIGELGAERELVPLVRSDAEELASSFFTTIAGDVGASAGDAVVLGCLSTRPP